MINDNLLFHWNGKIWFLEANARKEEKKVELNTANSNNSPLSNIA